MATFKLVPQASASLTATGLGTLASANYVVSDAYNAGTNGPVDVIVEATFATTNVPINNQQIKLFCKAAWDGTNYQSGPESGSTTTAEPQLTFLGVVPIPTTATTVRKGFSVAAAYGGVLPPLFKVVAFNDCGVALTTGTLLTAEVWATVA